jgi:SPP1 family predicted phage head-tail adaptor
LTPVDDGRGGRTHTPVTLAEVWGRLVPLEGREQETAQRIVAGVTHEWLVRYSSALATLTPAHRISWSGRTFQIATVLNTEARNRELKGTAREITA